MRIFSTRWFGRFARRERISDDRLYGFAKNERDNIGSDELLTLREIGAAWLVADTRRLARALAEGALEEVGGDESKAESTGDSSDGDG